MWKTLLRLTLLLCLWPSLPPTLYGKSCLGQLGQLVSGKKTIATAQDLQRSFALDDTLYHQALTLPPEDQQRLFKLFSQVPTPGRIRRRAPTTRAVMAQIISERGRPNQLLQRSFKDYPSLSLVDKRALHLMLNKRWWFAGFPHGNTDLAWYGSFLHFAGRELHRKLNSPLHKNQRLLLELTPRGPWKIFSQTRDLRALIPLLTHEMEDFVLLTAEIYLAFWALSQWVAWDSSELPAAQVVRDEMELIKAWNTPLKEKIDLQEISPQDKILIDCNHGRLPLAQCLEQL